MLIHIRHAVQKELMPDRLMFRFEAAALDARLGAFSRWFHRRKPKEGTPSAAMIQAHDRLFFQLPPAVGDFGLRLPPAAGTECDIMLSPLASLDRRGQSSLKMTPRSSVNGSHLIYTELWVGTRRLLYISPESLISRTFRKDLNRILKGSPPGSLIVDEAHAVSEWSDRFNAVYHRLPRMIEDLRRHNPALSVVAVTAAAGRWIGRDVRAVLGLEDRSPEIPRDCYRPTVSHQAVVVRSPAEKESAYEQLLWRDIPAMMTREGVAEPASAFPQYQDPYAVILKEAVPEDKIRTVVSMSERRYTDSGSPHVLVRTAMGDSVIGWLYKTANAADGGHRLHGIRLADLPSRACEEDLDQRRSRIPACGNRVCPFGRDALCDYGKQHHVIQQTFPEFRESFTDVFRVLDRLLAAHRSKGAQVEIPVPDPDGKRMQKALYRLCLLGVIDIFFIDYRKSPPVFAVSGFKPDIRSASVALRVLRYLKKHDLSHKPAAVPEGLPENIPAPSPARHEFSDAPPAWSAATSAWLLEAHAAEPFLSLDRRRPLFDRLAFYLPLMMDVVPRNLKSMAYRRLWNLKTYMEMHPCRYAGLIRSVRAVADAWRCRACDRCRPDLAFDLSGPLQARRPEMPAAEELIRARCRADGAPSDMEGMGNQADGGIDGPGNVTMRAACLLEDDPRNLTAIEMLVQHSAGAEKKRHEKDLADVAAGDRRMAAVMRLCETAGTGGRPTVSQGPAHEKEGL